MTSTSFLSDFLKAESAPIADGNTYRSTEIGKATLFDYFYDEWHKVLPDEVDNIAFRMYAIGNRFGAREQYFKMFEGKPGDGVCALFDVPNSKLRLYGIRFGSIALILGGGAEKPKNIRSWQEDQNP